jgi:Hint domain
MSGHDFTGTYSAGITLTNPAYSPVTIGPGALVTNANTGGVALQSTLESYLTIGNYGSIGGYTAGVSLASAGTVVNHASISASQTAGSGFYYIASSKSFIPISGGVIVFGGGVSNAASAVIATYLEAVAIGNDGSGGGAVVNAGTIISTSTRAGFGVVLAAGGIVSNAATGTITGGRYGLLVPGSNAAAVINQGVIASGATAAIDLFPGGFVSNAAGGTITGARYGIIAAGSVGSNVENAGVIDGTDVVGVFLPTGGTLSNASTGTIAGGFGGLIAYGTISSSATNNGGISGHYFGAKLTEPNGVFLNTGSIVSTATTTGSPYFDAAGVALVAGGVVTNGIGGSIGAAWKGVEIGAVTANIGGTVINQGTIFAADAVGDGAAVWIHGPASITNAGSGTISGGAFGVVLYNQATVVNQGSIFGTEYAVFESNPTYTVRVVDYPGAHFSGAVQGSSLTSASRGILELASGATGGTITGFRADTAAHVFSGYVGFGEVQVDAGATWAFGGTVTAAQTVAFDGPHTTLDLTTPRAMAGTITGFALSDTIVLGGITDVTAVSLTSGNTLEITESGGPGLALQFDPAQDFGGRQFQYTVTGGGTNLTIPCFAAGTRIATSRGPVAVERLREGDEVITVSGAREAIKWIGHRRVDCRRHPSPERVWPVRIAAHAFGEGRPQRALMLSPDHSVFVEGVLIPIKFLVNDATIAQVELDSIHYYHLELERHDVVLAEGLPAETYLETGGRAAFENADVMQLHPDFAPDDGVVGAIWGAKGYAPLLGSNGEFERARRMVAWQADMLARPRRGRRRASTAS